MLKKSMTRRISIMSNAAHFYVHINTIIYPNNIYLDILRVNTSGTSINKKKWHHLHHYHPRPKETKQILSQRNG